MAVVPSKGRRGQEPFAATSALREETIQRRWNFVGGLYVNGSGVPAYAVPGTWTGLQTFRDNAFLITDETDITKTVKFSMGGAAANSDLTLAWAGTADATVTFPNGTTTLAGLAVLQTFTADQTFNNLTATNVTIDPTLSVGSLGVANVTIGGYAMTFPGGVATLAALNRTQTWTAAQTFAATTFNATTPATAMTINVDGSGSFSGKGLLIADANDAFTTEIQRNPGAGADNVVFLPTGADVILVGTDETVELFNKTLDGTCNLESSTASVGCRFQDITTSTKRLRMILSGAVGNNAFTISTTAARNYTFGNIQGNVVIVGNDPPAVASGNLGAVDLTAQTANITTTNLSSTPPAGVYVVEVYIMTTTADVTAGTQAVVIGWTDNVGATTNTVIAAHSLAATGRSTGRALVRVSSADITYAVTNTGGYGTSQYAVYVRTISLG